MWKIKTMILLSYSLDPTNIKLSYYKKDCTWGLNRDSPVCVSFHLVRRWAAWAAQVSRQRWLQPGTLCQWVSEQLTLGSLNWRQRCLTLALAWYTMARRAENGGMAKFGAIKQLHQSSPPLIPHPTHFLLNACTHIPAKHSPPQVN